MTKWIIAWININITPCSVITRLDFRNNFNYGMRVSPSKQLFFYKLSYMTVLKFRFETIYHIRRYFVSIYLRALVKYTYTILQKCACFGYDGRIYLQFILSLVSYLYTSILIITYLKVVCNVGFYILFSCV